VPMISKAFERVAGSFADECSVEDKDNAVVVFVAQDVMRM
jgi:hypothetical protein